jgi:hypothetical protein
MESNFVGSQELFRLIPFINNIIGFSIPQNLSKMTLRRNNIIQIENRYGMSENKDTVI